MTVVERKNGEAVLEHPNTPWYIVVLLSRRRRYLTPFNRLTLTVAAPAAVEEAHREFATVGHQVGISELADVQQRDGQVSFLFSDLDRNWWEVTAPEG